MFALRGIAVSFSVFLMVYCALSLAVCFTWRRIRVCLQHHRVHRIADLLFALRMFPLVTAVVITAAFTVPSFLLLEPRAIDEPVGGAPLLLGLCGAVVALLGVGNAVIAMLRASRTISRWTSEAEPVETAVAVPVLRIRPDVPAMTATGVLHPKVLVSRSAEFLLSARELQTALNHEMAHVRRRDNLRKLLLRVVVFPWMSGLEASLLEATEMAADDAAVSNPTEALDLAAALIKLSRFAPAESRADLNAALVHSPASLMNARVERLISWNEERRIPPQTLSVRYGVGAALAMLLMFGVTYSQLLSEVHAATEWLMQ
jgi:beta-lactamase regulating signal transducer with metallopeptidase domain